MKNFVVTLFVGLLLVGCSQVQDPPRHDSFGNSMSIRDDRGLLKSISSDSEVSSAGVHNLPSSISSNSYSGYSFSDEDLKSLIGGDRVYFSLNSYQLNQQGKRLVASLADYLLKSPSSRIIIEGHCDERGTREYNIALGQKRADSVKNYLVSLGVSPQNLSAVSFGKERLEVFGNDFKSHRSNRRAVFKTN